MTVNPNCMSHKSKGDRSAPKRYLAVSHNEPCLAPRSGGEVLFYLFYVLLRAGRALIYQAEQVGDPHVRSNPDPLSSPQWDVVFLALCSARVTSPPSLQLVLLSVSPLFLKHEPPRRILEMPAWPPCQCCLAYRLAQRPLCSAPKQKARSRRRLFGSYNCRPHACCS